MGDLFEYYFFILCILIVIYFIPIIFNILVLICVCLFVCLSDHSQPSRPRRSNMWDHFTRTTLDKARCHYCECEISTGGSASNLRRHLLKKHPEYYPECDKRDSLEHEPESYYTAEELPPPQEEHLGLIKVEEVINSTNYFIRLLTNSKFC